MSGHGHKMIDFKSNDVRCYQNFYSNSKDFLNTIVDLVCALHIFILLCFCD